MDKKKFLDKIEEEKSTLIKELNLYFPNVELSNISNVSSDLEVYLKEYLKIILMKYSYELFFLKKNEHNLYLTMEDNFQLYSLNLEADVINFNTLTIFLNPIGTNFRQKDIKKFIIKINSYGKIKQIKFHYFENLSINFDILNSIIVNTIETAYAWFKLEIEKIVSNEKMILSTNLYNYLKQIIPSEELRKNLWFASITDNYGFRLIDRDIALGLFDIIDKSSDIYGDSTNQFVAEMLSTKLPSNKLLMQKAIDNNIVLDGDISDASYFQEGNIYAAAMSSLYGTNKFTIHPIYISEDVNVLLLYPTELRNRLEQIIESHKVTLEDMSKKSTSKLHITLKFFDISDKLEAGRFGEFFGGTIKGILGLNY